MESIYEPYSFEYPAYPSETDQNPDKQKTCPGLHQFCPHYLQGVCDVKYRECVLYNSLQTSTTILRMEREKLLKQPTPQNLELIAQINEALRESSPEPEVDAAAIFRDKFKGRIVAAGLFALIVIIAVIMYMT